MSDELSGKTQQPQSLRIPSLMVVAGLKTKSYSPSKWLLSSWLAGNGVQALLTCRGLEAAL